MKSLILSMLSAASCLGASLEWPEFRGPGMQGYSAATNVPIHWSATQNVLWKIDAPAGWSSPVVSGGRVYLTGAITNGTGFSLKVVCVQLSDGKPVWDQEVFSVDDPGSKHKKNGVASPTPIVRDGKLYAHFGHMGTAALDLNGKILWKQTSIKYPPVHGNGGSPALVDGLLVFSCDGASDPFLVALDAKSGEIKWKTPRHSKAQKLFSFSTPLVVNDEIISPAAGFVGAYEPKTGRELWRVDYGEGYSVVPRPVFAHGLIFIGTGYDRPAIYVINPKERSVAWTQAKSAPNTPSMLVVGEELYAVSDAGIASCFDAKTGATHWNERLGGGFSASPVFADGKIYFQNEEGFGYIVKASKTFELIAKNDLADRTLASPAVVDNSIILRSASFLWRIGAKQP